MCVHIFTPRQSRLAFHACVCGPARRRRQSSRRKSRPAASAASLAETFLEGTLRGARGPRLRRIGAQENHKMKSGLRAFDLDRARPLNRRISRDMGRFWWRSFPNHSSRKPDFPVHPTPPVDNSDQHPAIRSQASCPCLRLRRQHRVPNTTQFTKFRASQVSGVKLRTRKMKFGATEINSTTKEKCHELRSCRRASRCIPKWDAWVFS